MLWEDYCEIRTEGTRQGAGACVNPRAQESNNSESTEPESSIHFCAFFLLYAFGFSDLRVTGLMVQTLRLSASSSRFFFFESFAYGTNFSTLQSSFAACLLAL